MQTLGSEVQCTPRSAADDPRMPGESPVVSWLRALTGVAPVSSVASDPAGNLFLARSDTELSKLAANGELSWSKAFGSLVVSDELGNAYVAGTFATTLQLGSSELHGVGGSDVYLVKLDPSGTPSYGVVLGGAGDERVQSLALDSARNVIISGTGLGTLKLDPEANILWSKDFFGQVAVDALGNVLLTGALTGSEDFGGGALTSAGAADIFLVKLSPTGEHIFSRRFGDAAEQRGQAIAVDHAGNALIGGIFAGQVDFGVGALVLRPGACPQEVWCESAGFVAKLDANGNALWSVSRTPMRALSGLAVSSADEIVLSGTLPGNVRPYRIPLLSELSGDGAELWRRSDWPETGIGEGHDVVVDRCDNVLWSVSVSPSLGSDEQPYLAKLLP